MCAFYHRAMSILPMNGIASGSNWCLVMMQCIAILRGVYWTLFCPGAGCIAYHIRFYSIQLLQE